MRLCQHRPFMMGRMLQPNRNVFCQCFFSLFQIGWRSNSYWLHLCYDASLTGGCLRKRAWTRLNVVMSYLCLNYHLWHCESDATWIFCYAASAMLNTFIDSHWRLFHGCSMTRAWHRALQTKVMIKIRLKLVGRVLLQIIAVVSISIQFTFSR